MTVTAVVVAQWGDEGKGKVVDYLAQAADLVVRYNGGDNAGHTIVNELGTFKLRLTPSGIFNPAVTCLIGPGVVVNPTTLLAELADLDARGVGTGGLLVSERAHVVMPYHLLLDQIQERARGETAQGTTGRGIAPAYADKASRIGLRIGDLLDGDFLRRQLREIAEWHDPVLVARGAETLDVSGLARQCLEWGEALRPRIADTLPVVHRALREDQRVILEGQLGALRDLDWGIYPFSTSSTTLAGGACAGAGVPPHRIGRVVGVAKAYTTAVGAGPVPAELSDDTGELLRAAGQEYGTATGRARRCGWFDAVATRFAAELNGVDELALTKLDVLDGLPRLRVCVAYRAGSRLLDSVPTARPLEQVTPVYEDLPGWRRPTAGIRDLASLPDEALAYVRRIEALVGVPVRLVGTGAHRHDTIHRRDAAALFERGCRPAWGRHLREGAETVEGLRG